MNAELRSRLSNIQVNGYSWPSWFDVGDDEGFNALRVLLIVRCFCVFQNQETHAAVKTLHSTSVKMNTDEIIQCHNLSVTYVRLFVWLLSNNCMADEVFYERIWLFSECFVWPLKSFTTAAVFLPTLSELLIASERWDYAAVTIGIQLSINCL